MWINLQKWTREKNLLIDWLSPLDFLQQMQKDIISEVNPSQHYFYLIVLARDLCKDTEQTIPPQKFLIQIVNTFKCQYQ